MIDKDTMKKGVGTLLQAVLIVVKPLIIVPLSTLRTIFLVKNEIPKASMLAV